MFRDGTIEGVVFKPLKRFSDRRGWLVELYREDEMTEANHPVMAYVSETLPGVARGPHFHHDQSDYFAFIGPGDFKLYLWDIRETSPSFNVKTTTIVGTSNLQAVIIPPGVVHAYKNVSDHPGWVFNGPNRLYAGKGKQDPVDEIRYEEVPDCPYVLD
jgi:dTDP-4-dehydrorhamnose 3,5-epimerase